MDYVDIVGHRKTNISDAEVHKHTLHGNYVASAVRQYDQPEIEYAHANESTKQEIQVSCGYDLANHIRNGWKSKSGLQLRFLLLLKPSS